jgi:hypothetical protein
MFESDDDWTWASVRIHEGATVGEYWGKIRSDLLEQILRSADTPERPAPQWLVLESAHWWMTPGNTFKSQQAANEKFGYSDRVFFPLRVVTRIIPLTQEFVDALPGPPANEPERRGGRKGRRFRG